jgi:hypothetical protein
MAMTMTWNVAANKLFESGLDRGVLYVKSGGTYPLGVAWEGLISLTEKPGGVEPTDLYANNEKYAQLFSKETFEATIEAYTYPDEFLACLGITEDGTDPGAMLHQQDRVGFGIAYRNYVGSEAAGQTDHYKIHLIYGLTAKPSEVARNTINDSPEATTFSWDVTSVPVSVTGGNAVSMITLDSGVLTAPNLAAVEAQLYGTDDPITANLPLPDALLALLT